MIVPISSELFFHDRSEWMVEKCCDLKFDQISPVQRERRLNFGSEIFFQFPLCIDILYDQYKSFITIFPMLTP